ncbi:MAG: helix-turn-helix domain-containing protein [Vulcanimicrobiaceae bacterium]
MVNVMSAVLDVGQIVAAPDAREQESIRSLGEAIARSGPGATGYLVARDQEPLPLPPALYEVLVRAAQMLAHGGAISVLPADRMLTSQEAADFLNMSRTYLVRLLDEGKIPFERVGRHRRVALADLMTFDVARRRERRQHLRSLIELSKQYGLYDQDEEAMQHLARLRDADRNGGE